MIPKIIHYCWFGRGEMPKLMKKCLKSWKKYCPDWKIVRWDEDSFDVNSTVWTKQAYASKKYAFVADYVRVRALVEQGGVYLDTDQELIKPLDPFLKHSAFLGFLDRVNVSAGVMGAEQGNPVMTQLLRYYEGRSFLTADGAMDIKPNTNWMTDILLEQGLKLDDSFQQLKDVAVYPQTYFCPTSCVSPENLRSRHTVALHHWAMTWRTEKAKKDFARAKRHQTWWYRGLIWLRYLPNRAVRLFVSEETIDRMKQKVKK